MLEFAEARAGVRRPGALRPHLDRLRGRDPCRPLRRTRSRRRPVVSATPTSARSSKPSSWSALTPSSLHDPAPEHRRRGSPTAAGRRPSTSSTGRCGRSSRGLFTAFPPIPRRRWTWSRVDYVADAIYALCEAEGGIGETYHLTAGRERDHDSRRSPGAPAATSAGRCPRCCRRRSSPRCRPAAPPRIRRSTRGAPTSRTSRSTPCSTTARPGLGWSPQGIAASPLRDYLERLLDFATRSRWGKRPITRVDALTPLRRFRASLIQGPHPGGCPRPAVARSARQGQAEAIDGLADTARFAPTDPDAVVAASLACPICLRGEDVRWHAVLRGYDPSVQCRCPSCDARWRVYLTPDQALRLGLMHHAHAA